MRLIFWHALVGVTITTAFALGQQYGLISKGFEEVTWTSMAAIGGIMFYMCLMLHVTDKLWKNSSTGTKLLAFLALATPVGIGTLITFFMNA